MVERFSKDLNIPVFVNPDTNDITEQQAVRLSQINQESASVPETIMVEAAKNNVDESMVQQLNSFFSRSNESSSNRLKNAVFDSLGVNPETGGFTELGIKGLFLGVRELWEQTFPRVGRAISLSQQGVENPWKKAKVSPMAIWNEKRKAGETIDLGTGLFGNTNPEKTDMYKELIDNGVSPLAARQYVQKRLGANIWTDIEEDSRKVKMTEETARALEARGRGGQATFGRVMWQPLHFIAGPEDRAYDFYTGTIDLIANLFDPSFLLGKGIKTYKTGKGMLPLSDEAAAGVGLANGFVRKSFSKRTAREVIEGKEGLKLGKFLFENKDKPAEILEQSNFSFVNKYIMRNQELSDDVTKFMLDLEKLDANSVEEGGKLVQGLLTDKVLASATGGVVPTYGPKMKRFGRARTMLDTYFGTRYGKRLSATNPDNLLVNYTKFLKLLDPTGKNIDRNARLSKLIKELDALETKDPLLRGRILISEITEDIGYVRKTIEGSLDEKQRAKAKPLFDAVFRNLKKYTEDVSEEVGSLARKYTSLDNMPEDAEKVFRKHFVDKGYSDETIEQMFNTFSGRPIIETMLTQDFYLPDPSDVVRLVNNLDKSMKGQYLNVLGIVGEGPAGRFLNSYTSKIFKPLVLLRPAWTVRVIAEEQIRAIADGVLGVLDHPIGVMARLGLMDSRPSYAKSGWLNSGRFEVGIAEAESRAFNTLTGKTARQGVEWIPAKKFDTKGITKEWKEGQFRVITNYMDSYLARGIARINRAAPKDREIQMGKLIDKIATNGTVEREALISLTAAMGDTNIYKSLKTSKDKELIRAFLDTLDEDMTKALTGLTKEQGGVIADDLWELIETGKLRKTDIDPEDKVEDLLENLYEKYGDKMMWINDEVDPGLLFQVDYDESGKTIIDLQSMFIKESQRNKGIGKEIINEIKKVSEELGIPIIARALDSSDTGFFAKNGFKMNPDYEDMVYIPKKIVDQVVDLRKLTRPKLTKSEKIAYDQDKLSRELQKKISKQSDENLKAGIKEYTDKFGDTLPDVVDWKTKPHFDNQKPYEKITEWGMTYLMTVPTNKMSRIPVFKSTYWETSANLISVSTPAIKKQILDGAKEAGISSKRIKRWEKIKDAGEKGIDDAALIEELAKAKGVEKVKGLLYDITESRRFWDLTRWIFPFGNAYQEVITTWLGIMRANPGVVARTQTTWAGATQPTDQFEDTGKGFMYTNPTNGQAVFNYPGSGIMQDYMFKDAEEGTDVKINMPVYASSINIVGSIMPGIGPVIRFPAAFIFKNFPEEGFIQKAVFGEFPAPDITDPSEWTKALGLKPAWLDKFLTVAFNKGENTTGIYGNTVMDTYKALLYSGQIDDSTEEGMKEGMELALQKSKTLFLFRAATQMMGPAGAVSPLYELKPENMDYFFFETLADEYRSMKIGANYDDAKATEEFINTFGLNPLPLTVAKSVSIEKFPVTTESFNWYKENKDLYDQYPLVAWYLEPPPAYAEFNWSAYKKALLNNKRAYRTPEQWAIAKNKLLGAVALRQYEAEIGIINNNTVVARTLRNEKKKELQQRYWGYGQPEIVGEPAQPSIDMQVEQLERMVQDPLLKDNSVVITTKKYLDARQQVIDGFVDAGLSETIWKSSSKYIGVRLALRQIADELMVENPDFGPLFDQLLSKELEPEFEDDLLVELNKANK